MATVFTLDDIRAAAEAEYGSTDIDLGDGRTLSLVNPLRLGQEDRDRLTDLISEVNDDASDDEKSEDEKRDEADVMRAVIRLVARNKDTAEEFIDIAGEDLALLAVVFSRYTSSTQPGEASASQG